MSSYKLHSKPLSDFTFIAGQSPNSNIAVSGAWDMPARLGTTFRDWGNRKGIEPWVSKKDIDAGGFGGRDIKLYGWVRAIDKLEALTVCYDMYNYFDTLTELSVLESDQFGSWNVYLNGEVEVSYISQGWASVMIPFREPIVPIPTTLPTATITSELGIDGISFDELGLRVLSVKGQFNRPAPKGFEVSVSQKEGFAITKTGALEVDISFLLMKPDYTSFVSVINGLHALFALPGLRYLTYKNDGLRDFFVKDGFKVTNVRTYGGGVFGFLDVKITTTSYFDEWGFLTDNSGTEILTDLFKNIVIA